MIHHEDLAEASGAQTSFAVPEQLNRRTTLYFAWDAKPLTLEAGGLFSGSTKVGDAFTWVRETSGRGYLESGYEVIDDEVKWGDTFGGRVRLTWEGALRWYGQGSLHGIVADGGYQGRHPAHGLVAQGERTRQPLGALVGGVVPAGAAGDLAPGPLPAADPALQPAHRGPLQHPHRPLLSRAPAAERARRPLRRARQPRDRGRGAAAGLRSDAGDLVPHLGSRHPRGRPPSSPPWTCGTGGTRSAATPTPSPWPTAPSCPSGRLPPAGDEWEAKLHTVHNPRRGLRLATTFLAGEGEPRGDDPRRIRRYGGDLRVWWHTVDARTRLRLDDWGPYDFHRDFNLTYPLQWYGDVSYGLKPAGLEGASTRFGLRAQMRTLDGNSPEYVADPGDAGATGAEVEVGLYVHVGL